MQSQQYLEMCDSLYFSCIFRNRRKRKKMKDRLNDLGVDWRMGVTDLELEDIPQSNCLFEFVAYNENKLCVWTKIH